MPAGRGPSSPRSLRQRGSVAISRLRSRARRTRPGAEGLRLVAASWHVSGRSGAGLAAVLDRVGAALREDEEAHAEVTAALGLPRATAKLLAGLPLVGTRARDGDGCRPGRLPARRPGRQRLSVGRARAWRCSAFGGSSGWPWRWRADLLARPVVLRRRVVLVGSTGPRCRLPREVASRCPACAGDAVAERPGSAAGLCRLGAGMLGLAWSAGRSGCWSRTSRAPESPWWIGTLEPAAVAKNASRSRAICRWLPNCWLRALSSVRRSIEHSRGRRRARRTARRQAAVPW